jgi:competence protein ComEC
MSKIILWGLIILSLANVFNWWVINNYFHIKDSVSFLSVGQGDAELIHNKAGNILIDAGPNDKVLFELGKILPFYDKTIDVFVLSHPNKDHYNGLFDLLDKYKIRAVITNNIDYQGSVYQKLLKELKQRNILILKGFAGVKIDWHNSDNLSLIYPPEDTLPSSDLNATCLVADLFWRNYQVLFPGDIGASQEKQLIPLLSSTNTLNILKVAHHGSGYSSSDALLKAFQPKLAIIEVGENSYNQPHPDTLQRLQDHGITVYRTDVDGTIQLVVDDQERLRIYQNKSEF